MLVESAPATFRVEPEDHVVALTPEACYELDRRGEPYEVTTDPDLDSRLAELEPVHWQEQLGWIEALDELIAIHVPETRRWRFGAATLYAMNLKTLVDPVRIRALELSAALESCDSVVLYHRAEAEPPGPSVRFFAGASVTARVLPLLTRARGLPLEERQAEERQDDGGISAAGPTPAREPRLVERIKARVRRGLGAQHGSGERRPARAPATGRPLTLLFADFGYDLTYLLARAGERGHRCLRIVGDVVREDGAAGTELACLPVDGEAAGWIAAAEEIAAADHSIWDWPNEWVPGVPLADVLRPKLLEWLRDVMPAVAARAGALAELLAAEDVDFVLGANVVEPDVMAAAAVTAPPVQSVLVDHGHAAFASEVFDLIMLRHVDHNFCATSELARYMESRGSLYAHATAQVHVGSYRWRRDASPTRPAQPPEPLPEGKPVLVYALTSTAGSARYLNSPWFGDSWYYRLCREIVDVLARHPEVHSVVKLFPGDGILRNPIDLYVRDLGLDHVVASRAPLRDWIPWADRIVLDHPSTGLYETAVAGVPYLALLYTHHRHRATATQDLGAAAVEFAGPAEAARAVESFVTAPSVTAPHLEPEGDEILLTLERLAGR